MKFTRFFPALIVILTALLLAGCIEYEEDLYLERDGSGRIEMRLGIIDLSQFPGSDSAPGGSGMPTGPRQASEEDFRMMAEGVEGLEYVSGRSYTENGNRYVEAVLEFDSLEALAAMSDSGMGEQPDFYGDITWREDDGQYVFNRRLDTSGGADTGEVNALGSALLGGMLSQYQMRFTTHFPGQVVSTNEAGVISEEDPDTVTWTVPLGRVLSEPVQLQARVEAGGGPLSWAILLAIAVVVIVLGAIIVIIVILPRKS